MFTKKEKGGYSSPLPGISMKTIVYGERTLMTEFLLEKGADLPNHSHPYEQTGYLIRGKLALTIGDSTYDAGPGDSWSIPVDIPHGAEVLEDSLAIEVFSPLREDYLPENLG